MPWGLRHFRQSGQAAFSHLQLLSSSAQLRHSAIASLFRILSGAGTPILRIVRVRLRGHARARAFAGGRTGTGPPGADAAVAEAVRGANLSSAGPRFVLASAVLRLQCMERREVCREAALHPSQSGCSRTGEAAGRLAMEQLPALRDRSGRSGGDRIAMDGAATREVGVCAHGSDSFYTQSPRPSGA